MKMKKPDEHGVAHVTRAGGNIFQDLGFGKDDAQRMHAQAHATVSQKLSIREELAEEIAVWIKEKDLKQQEAAEILLVSRPRVSDIVRHKVGKFSIDTLVELVNRTGKRVSLRVA
ncbi:helix-turn-helix domain-containing protein [Arenimonas alkanexedens]